MLQSQSQRKRPNRKATTIVPGAAFCPTIALKAAATAASLPTAIYAKMNPQQRAAAQQRDQISRRFFSTSTGCMEELFVQLMGKESIGAFLEASLNPNLQRQLWRRLCHGAHLQVKPTRQADGQLATKQKNDENISLQEHCQHLATLVICEMMDVVAASLASRWIQPTNDTTGQKNPLRAQPTRSKLSMTLALTNARTRTKTHKQQSTTATSAATTFLDLTLTDHAPNFCTEMLFHLRPGTILECFPKGTNTSTTNLDNVFLACVAPSTNRATLESTRQLTLVVHDSAIAQRHGDSINHQLLTVSSLSLLQITPIASLVSEFRQLESCLLLMTQKRSISFEKSYLGDPKDAYDNSDDNNRTRIAILLAQAKLLAEDEHWTLPELNDKQIQAATSFLTSPKGRLSLVQGYVPFIPTHQYQPCFSVSYLQQWIWHKLIFLVLVANISKDLLALVRKQC